MQCIPPRGNVSSVGWDVALGGDQCECCVPRDEELPAADRTRRPLAASQDYLRVVPSRPKEHMDRRQTRRATFYRPATLLAGACLAAAAALAESTGTDSGRSEQAMLCRKPSVRSGRSICMATERPMTKSPLAPARAALATAREALPAYSSKFLRKDFTQHQHFALLSLRVYLRADYRGLEAMLRVRGDLRDALGPEKVPDHSTMQKAAERLLVKGGSTPSSAGPWPMRGHASWSRPSPARPSTRRASRPGMSAATSPGAPSDPASGVGGVPGPS